MVERKESETDPVIAQVDMKRLERWRLFWERFRLRFLAGIDLLLALLLVIFLNALASRAVYRFSPGRPQQAGLSSQTLNVLGQIQDPLTLVLFASRESTGYEEWDALLRAYEAACPHIRVRRVDPVRDLKAARDLVNRHRLDRPYVITIDAGLRGAVVDLQTVEQDVRRTPWMDRSTGIRDKGEQMISSAILGVLQTKSPVVAFATGEGEGDPDQFGPLGYSRFARELRRQAIRVVKILLAEGVPDGVDLLIVVGPSSPFSNAALLALQRYWERGGRTLFLLEAGGLEGLSDLLAKQGVQVVPPAEPLSGQGNPSGADSESEMVPARPVDHPVSRGIQDRVCLMDNPLELKPLEEGGKANEPGVRPVLSSLVRGRAESVRSYGMAVERRLDSGARASPSFRMVVIGDTTLATNARWGGGNGEFLMAAVNWLLQRDILLDTPPSERLAIWITGRNKTLRLLAYGFCGLSLFWLWLALLIRFVRRG